MPAIPSIRRLAYGARNRLQTVACACALACSAWSAPGLGAPVLGAQGTEPTSPERFRAVLKDRTEELDPRACGVGERVPDLAFTDVEGQSGKLSDYAERRALVIAVRQIGCPVGERYAPRLARLEREFQERGVDFLFVNLDKYLDPEEVRAKELDGPGAHGFQGRYVHDPEQAFGLALGTETTTVCYVLDASRTLRYRGAVDDQYGRGVILPEPRREFLREALEAVLVGEPVEVRATSAPGCRLDVAREPARPAPEQITYHRDVARILQTNCAQCHHEGGAGPFALETYEQVYNKRNMLRLVVEERIMPPWYANDASGPWKNDARLADWERELVLAWIEHGAPAGEAADGPARIAWPSGWLIGEPDVVFRLDREKELPAEGTIQWDPIPADMVAPKDLWIERLQILPTAPAVVHHVLMFFQPPLDFGTDERTRVMGQLAPFEQRPEPTWQFLAGLVPGSGPSEFPPGVGRFIPKGSRLRFDMHYTPNGRATVDRTMLGLVLLDEPPPLVSRMRAVQNFKLPIPPHTKVEFDGVLEFEEEFLARSINPHMHLRGTQFLATVLYPDGREEELIHLPVWDPDWQIGYYFAEPPILPAGTRIRIHGWFDNTAENPHNPDPSKEVKGGKQTWDEMLYMAVDCIQPRAVVEAAYAEMGGVVDHPLRMD
jgi:hypothetical protein